jgi:hypothetical protein
MDLEKFLKEFTLMEEDFNLKNKSIDWIESLYREASARFSEEEIIYGFGEFLKMSPEHVNSTYGYGGCPTRNGWMILFGMRKKDQDYRDNSKLQAEIVNKARILSIEKACEWMEPGMKERWLAHALDGSGKIPSTPKTVRISVNK